LIILFLINEDLFVITTHRAQMDLFSIVINACHKEQNLASSFPNEIWERIRAVYVENCLREIRDDVYDTLCSTQYDPNTDDDEAELNCADDAWLPVDDLMARCNKRYTSLLAIRANDRFAAAIRELMEIKDSKNHAMYHAMIFVGYEGDMEMFRWMLDEFLEGYYKREFNIAIKMAIDRDQFALLEYCHAHPKHKKGFAIGGLMQLAHTVEMLEWLRVHLAQEPNMLDLMAFINLGSRKMVLWICEHRSKIKSYHIKGLLANFDDVWGGGNFDGEVVIRRLQECALEK